MGFSAVVRCLCGGRWWWGVACETFVKLVACGNLGAAGRQVGIVAVLVLVVILAKE